MIGNKNKSNEFDIPLGISMAVSQNPILWDRFVALSGEQRRSLMGEISYKGRDDEIPTDSRSTGHNLSADLYK